ncbi:hypothetical protein ACLEPN_29010 [Myxococcus sp. 1LA]
MTSGTEAAESASRRESRAEARAQAQQLRNVAEALASRHVNKAEAESAQRVRDVEAQTRQRLQEIDAQIAQRQRAAEAGAAAQEGFPAEAPPGTPSESGAAAEPTAPQVPSDATAATEARVDEAAPDEQPAEAATDVEEAEPSEDEQPSEDPAPPSERQASAEGEPTGTETAEQRMARRIRAVEAAAQGKDSGTSLAAAIAALVMDATLEVDDDESPAASGKSTDAQADDTRAGADSQDAKTPTKGGGKALRLNGFSVWSLAFWAALFAALQLAQWVVIALSRDYHDAISRKASLLTGVEPEEQDFEPRVRVNFPWLRKKLKRRWRAFLLLMVGVPALFMLTLPFMCASHAVFTALFTLWSAWWFVVFTAAKSARAWEPSTGPNRPPWFLRAWTTLTTRVPGLRWGALQRYGASWGRRTEEVFAPIASTERYPWVFAGLSVVRFMGSFPPMKFFVRPLIPVASAHLLADDVAAAKKALAAGEEASPPAAEVPRPADVW